jgi:hypothetical protein
MAKEMFQYRCYFLNVHNHVTSFSIINLPTDALARAEADELWKSGPSHGVEVWNGAQMIHHETRVAV